MSFLFLKNLGFSPVLIYPKGNKISLMIQKNSAAGLQGKFTFIAKLCEERKSCLLDKKSYFEKNRY